MYKRWYINPTISLCLSMSVSKSVCLSLSLQLSSMYFRCSPKYILQHGYFPRISAYVSMKSKLEDPTNALVSFTSSLGTMDWQFFIRKLIVKIENVEKPLLYLSPYAISIVGEDFKEVQNFL